MTTLRYCLAVGLVLLVGQNGIADDPAADSQTIAEKATDTAEWMPKFVLLINELPAAAETSARAPVPVYEDSPQPFAPVPSPAEPTPAFPPSASNAGTFDQPKRDDEKKQRLISVPVYEVRHQEVTRDGKSAIVPYRVVIRYLTRHVPVDAPLPVTIECDDVAIQGTAGNDEEPGYEFQIEGRLRLRLITGATLTGRNASYKDGVLTCEDAELTSADASISFSAGTLKLDVERLRLSRPEKEAAQPLLQPAQDGQFPAFAEPTGSQRTPAPTPGFERPKL
ncbi:hypothetical protein Mal4_28950 [Maioricimonas rarisocia]|uniref:Uncharacterized protein n=1 Tax=Maioricimonas rarisocia TaxID=2528026 RepID=A0A517Z7W6_9PLAN|nr:hypothetical protein [Maioricimonas rarisocia]QDU38566.1 hypothetical protein Mal4_28950 [Maioricimonas rarisocia]